MAYEAGGRQPWWTWAWPAAGFAAFLMSLAVPIGAIALPVAAVLVATVFAAVYHSELIAHRVGEPFGTLVLAIAVTVIEVALIVSLMLTSDSGEPALARDTVFAAVMIVCNGIVGLCLLSGGLRHRVQAFRLDGALGALAVLAPLVVLTLIVPNAATSAAGPVLSPAQLAFSGAVSLLLYVSFVFVQTVRHRDYFLPPDATANENEHAAPPTTGSAWRSFALLLVSLVAVVGLAKALSPTLEDAVLQSGLPKKVVGIAIAALVLLPEGLAAWRAAKRDRLQTSMNLALGSALATTGLTIPAVALVSLVLGQPLLLGLGATESVLLALTLLVATITLGTGRTTMLQGIVHLSIFTAFLFYAAVP